MAEECEALSQVAADPKDSCWKPVNSVHLGNWGFNRSEVTIRLQTIALPRQRPWQNPSVDNAAILPLHFSVGELGDRKF
jgi:hypothetical protein